MLKDTTPYNPFCKHISAVEGKPSTFWVSRTGKYYKTKKEAAKDEGKVENPDDYVIKKSFLTKYKTYILAAFIGAIVTAAILYGAPIVIKKLKK